MAVRKGFLFTISALLLLIALAALVSLQANHKPKDRSVLDTRVATMNEFARTVKEDMRRGLYISSFRAVLSMEQVVANGSFVNDTGQSFRDAVLEGKISNVSMPLMSQSTFPEWAFRIQQRAADIDILANISVGGISIRHSDPWTLLVESNITVNLTDALGTAVWRFNHSPSAAIDVSGLEDPLFTINTQGRVIRQINATPFEGSYVTGTNNTANLKAHIDGFFYANSTSAPSFLMRLEGRYSPSEFGVESFVSVPELQVNGLPQYQRSMVDYIYFGNLSNGTLSRINNTYENWLILDTGHLSKYQSVQLAIPLP